MSKSIVAIVGRPNVGKSTLFNRIVGRRLAIVEDVPGVTRDRNYAEAGWEDKRFIIVDTGGFYPGTDDVMLSEITEQAMYAIGEASVVVHMVDAVDGLTPVDEQIARLLKQAGKTVLTAANKIDGEKRAGSEYDFYSLGVEEVFPVSAKTGFGYDDFMDRLAEVLPEDVTDTVEYPKVAVVGRPNVGKSTLINMLTGTKRHIVSSVAGTTRDSVDSVTSYYGKKYLFVDTAGIRRKENRGYSIERFSIVRALQSIDRAEIAVQVIDAFEGPVAEDQHIAGLVREAGKGLVVVLNKWDLLENPEAQYPKLVEAVRKEFWFMPGVPVLTASALTKKRITKIYPLIDGVLSECKKKIGRGELNRFMEEVVTDNVIPTWRNRKIKIYYISQVAVAPPAFVVVSNRPESLKDSFLKYIERKLREKYSFAGAPVIVMRRGQQ